VWYAESVAALNVVNRSLSIDQCNSVRRHKAIGPSVLAVVRKRLILENRRGLLTQTLDQLERRESRISIALRTPSARRCGRSQTARSATGRGDCQRVSRLAISILLASALAILSVGCSKEKTEEAAVPVTAANAEKATVQRVVTADVVLFPLQQAALVPKISAPVKQFYANRGSKVRP
jgi:hypothetical protein